jgi:general secretion pathway protein N
MKRRAAGWIALGLGAYLLSLIITLPAALVWRWAAPAQSSAGRVTGSVWSGQADGLHFAGRRLANLGWTLTPWAVLLGEVRGTARVADGALRADGRFRRLRDGTLELTDWTLDAPLADLLVRPGRGALPLSGELSIARGARVVWADGQPRELACAGLVRGLAVSAPQELALGDLALSCITDAGGPRLDIEDQGGPLAVQARVLFDASGRWSLDARLGSRPNSPPALRAALPLLGPPDGPDRVRVRYAGTLPGR